MEGGSPGGILVSRDRERPEYDSMDPAGTDYTALVGSRVSVSVAMRTSLRAMSCLEEMGSVWLSLQRYLCQQASKPGMESFKLEMMRNKQTEKLGIGWASWRSGLMKTEGAQKSTKQEWKWNPFACWHVKKEMLAEERYRESTKACLRESACLGTLPKCLYTNTCSLGNKQGESEVCTYRDMTSLGWQICGGMAHMPRKLQWRDIGLLGSTSRRGEEAELRFMVRTSGMHGALPWDWSGASWSLWVMISRHTNLVAIVVDIFYRSY